MERGGTGIPPDRARENWGRNSDFSEHKPVILGQASRSSESRGLPAPEAVAEPRTEAEAVRMVQLSQRLMLVGCQFLGQRLSEKVRRLYIHVWPNTSFNLSFHSRKKIF